MDRTDETRTRTFGDFELSLATLELRRGPDVVPLQRQPALVLAALVTRPGDVVSRDDLRRTVWSATTHVDFDRGLNYCIRHLRAALGDDARAPRFIETVARQGYRFVAPVSQGPLRPARRRATWAMVAAACAAAVVATVALETGGRSASHHAIAVRVAQTIHDFVF